MRASTAKLSPVTDSLSRCTSYFVLLPRMSLRRVRKKVDYAKFCQEEDNSSNNSDGKHILDKLL